MYNHRPLCYVSFHVAINPVMYDDTFPYKKPFDDGVKDVSLTKIRGCQHRTRSRLCHTKIVHSLGIAFGNETRLLYSL